MGAKIYNSNLTKQIIDGAKLQQSQGQIPNEIAEKVVPTMEVNPALLRVCNIVVGDVATSTSHGVYTTPADKDFFLVGATLAMSKIVTDSLATCDLTCVPIAGTTSRAILFLPGTTLNQDSNSISISLSTPILLKRSSAITIIKSANNGSVVASIMGYTVDNITA
jgi:hypothetical protein